MFGKRQPLICRLTTQAGFSLIELVVVIVVIGILLSMAMQSMEGLVKDARRAKTEREMEMLAKAIVGNPDIAGGGGRSDFGYVGDIGAFPSNLQALYQNPGYGTWNGPYILPGLTQDSTGFKIDEWGKAYTYSGGTTITSTGSGTTISKKIADATTDYLLNTVNGTIMDANDSLPGATYADSVDIKITIPDGSGSTTIKTYHPDSTGTFTLDSLPVGTHLLQLVYTPDVDTLTRYVTVLPRHKGQLSYQFASEFSAGGGTPGSEILRPDGTGSVTGLVASGCASNFQCVDEISSDDDATYVERASNSYATDVYSLGNPSASSGTIDSVVVHCQTKKEHTQGNVCPTLYVSSTEYNGTEQTLTTSYADYSQMWSTNPNTSAAWNWTEINNLQAGVKIKGQNSGKPAYCTQVWVEVFYID
ncbi:MAG: hypothetical protein DRP47_05710 [Candidatus Zixiibacteriota bacterium]|nr:MAG: hypothetical protein DRP47_05710 [candidate division Zixibacteria bacterium]